jgi:TPR repeat protein
MKKYFKIVLFLMMTMPIGFSLKAIALADSVAAPDTTSPLNPYKNGEDAYYRHDSMAAYTLWRPLADKGDAGAQLGIGNLFNFVMMDTTEATKWYRMAADQGNAEAQWRLGEMYSSGQGGLPKDQAEAIKWYRKSADQGFIRSEETMGFAYERGENVKQDYAEAMKWYLKVVDHSPRWVEQRIGDMYHEGHGVKQDDTEAEKWYQKAKYNYRGITGISIAGNGSLDRCPPGRSSTSTGSLAPCGWKYEPQSYDEAYKIYLKGAEQEDSQSEDLLGRLYRDGHGVKQNYTEAAKWFRKAADNRSNVGKDDLGLLYAEGGKDFPRNDKEAYFWLAMPCWNRYNPNSVDKDCTDINDINPPSTAAALEKLRKDLPPDQIAAIENRIKEWKPPRTLADDRGNCGYNGNGMRRTQEDETTWCRKAAEDGYVVAQETMGLLSERKDLGEAVKWFRKAASQGLASAPGGLGSLYSSGGVGLAQDWKEAYFWYTVGAEAEKRLNGFIETDGQLQAAIHLTPEQISTIDKRAQEWKPAYPLPSICAKNPESDQACDSRVMFKK